MSHSADPSGTTGRALLAAGTATYDHFEALDKVPVALHSVVSTLTKMGFTTVAAAPGYSLDPEPGDLRAAVRRAGRTASVVVVYYTGHGAHPERDRYYLVNRRSLPADIDESALPVIQLPRLLTRRDANGEVEADQPVVLIILDCCYSGTGGMEVLSDSLRGIGNPNTWVIASASALEFAQQGLFATALCDALEHPTTGPSTRFLSLNTSWTPSMRQIQIRPSRRRGSFNPSPDPKASHRSSPIHIMRRAWRALRSASNTGYHDCVAPRRKQQPGTISPASQAGSRPWNGSQGG